MKICIDCGETKEIAFFHKTNTGYRKMCKPCANIRYYRPTGKENAGRFKKGHIPVSPFQKGHVPVNKGKPRSPETVAKMSAKLKGRKFSPETLAKIAISRYYSVSRKSYVHRQWIAAVNEKHNHKCSHCESTDGLHAHHIKPWVQFPDFRFDVTNGILLCRSCHRKAEAITNPKPSPTKGKTPSKETRAKMSAAKKGKAPWNKGKVVGPHSVESNRKRSESMTDKWDEGVFSGRTKEQRAESAKLGWNKLKARG